MFLNGALNALKALPVYKAAKAWKGVCSRSLHHRVPPVSPEQQSPLRGRYLREEHNAPLALTATHRHPHFLPLSIMFHPLVIPLTAAGQSTKTAPLPQAPTGPRAPLGARLLLRHTPGASPPHGEHQDDDHRHHPATAPLPAAAPHRRLPLPSAPPDAGPAPPGAAAAPAPAPYPPPPRPPSPPPPPPPPCPRPCPRPAPRDARRPCRGGAAPPPAPRGRAAAARAR